MNAAAKVIHQSNLFDGQLADLRISKQLLLLIIVLSAVLASALSVVYSTNTCRTMLNKMEQEERQAYHLQMQWGQLLLEQASLATTSRVQRLAHDKLGMVSPVAKRLFLSHAP